MRYLSVHIPIDDEIIDSDIWHLVSVIQKEISRNSLRVECAVIKEDSEEEESEELFLDEEDGEDA